MQMQKYNDYELETYEKEIILFIILLLSYRVV